MALKEEAGISLCNSLESPLPNYQTSKVRYNYNHNQCVYLSLIKIGFTKVLAYKPCD